MEINTAIKKSPSYVTVIVVNFNGGELIIACLNALNKQTFQEFTIRVIDNASQDGSPMHIIQQFPHVHLLLLAENLGFAAGVNWGLTAAPLGEWVALLNPDTIPSPTWLECLLDAAHQKPEFAAFGCRMIQDREGRYLDGIGDAYHISGLPWRMGYGVFNGPRYHHSREIFSPCAAAALYRSAALDRIGYLDADLFCYVEDVDLGFRLRLAGYRAWYVADATLFHLGSGIVGRHSEFQLYYGHRNWIWVYIKNMPGIWLWLFLPAHIMMNIITVFWYSIKGHGRVLLRAKWDAIRGLTYWWRKRRAIQNTRRVSTKLLLQQFSWRLLPRR